MRFSTTKKASGSQFSVEISSVLLLTDQTCSLLCSFFVIAHFCLGLCLQALMEINAREEEKPQSTLADYSPSCIFNYYFH